jgi:hypothetical protein
MRRRIERGFLLAIALAGAAWIFPELRRAARWQLQGGVELLLAPSFPAPSAIRVPLRIAHAGGTYRGLSYTNSLEALDYNYARGARWFEMDFSRDARGTWWAVHEWKEIHERLGIPLDRDGRGLPDRQTGASPFRLASIERVLAWFGDHQDARLITDTKDDNPVLLQQLGSAPPALKRRIHPQIYRLREYRLARTSELGVPIFTTYRSRYPWWVLGRFVRHHPLLAVTITRDEASDACRALAGRVPLLTHTINDAAEEAGLMRAGISGIYTDELLP